MEESQFTTTAEWPKTPEERKFVEEYLECFFDVLYAEKKSLRNGSDRSYGNPRVYSLPKAIAF